MLPGKIVSVGNSAKGGNASGASGASGEFAALLGMLQASLAKGEKSENVLGGKKSLFFSSGERAKGAADQQALFSSFLGDVKTDQGIMANIPGTSDNLLSGGKDPATLRSTSEKKAVFSQVGEEVKTGVGKKESVRSHSKEEVFVSNDSDSSGKKTGLRSSVGISDDSGKSDPKKQVEIGTKSETSLGKGTRSAAVNAAAGQKNAGAGEKGLSDPSTTKESKSGVPLETTDQGNKDKEAIRVSSVSESQLAERTKQSSLSQQTTQTATGRKSSVLGASETNTETVWAQKNSQSKETRGTKWSGSRTPESDTITQKATDSKNAGSSTPTKDGFATKTQAGLEKTERSATSVRRPVENPATGSRTEKASEARMGLDAQSIESDDLTESKSAEEKKAKIFSPADARHTAKDSDREFSAKTPADSTTAVKHEATAEKETQNFREDVQSQSTVSKTGGSGFAKSVAQGTQTTGAEVFRQVQDQVEEMLAKYSWPATHRARLSLNPPSLGALDIEVEVRGDHVRATFVTASTVVKGILDSGMDTLRQSFSQAGMDQNETNVFLQQRDAGGRDSYRQTSGNRKKVGGVQAGLKMNSGRSDSGIASLQVYGDRLINVKV